MAKPRRIAPEKQKIIELKKLEQAGISIRRSDSWQVLIRQNIFHRITRNRRRENPAKVTSKKSAKSFLAKKSAKLPELSRAAVRPPQHTGPGYRGARKQLCRFLNCLALIISFGSSTDHYTTFFKKMTSHHTGKLLLLPYRKAETESSTSLRFFKAQYSTLVSFGYIYRLFAGLNIRKTGRCLENLSLQVLKLTF